MLLTHDPDFRALLKRNGWRSGQDVVIAFDHESVASLLSRLAFNEASNPCLIAIPHAPAPNGFRLMFMEAVRSRLPWRKSQGEPVNPQANVGMLYDSLLKCDAYVPSTWVGGGPSTTFSKAREPA
jgi:hypothetical protein